MKSEGEYGGIGCRKIKVLSNRQLARLEILFGRAVVEFSKNTVGSGVFHKKRQVKAMWDMKFLHRLYFYGTNELIVDEVLRLRKFGE